MKRLDVVIEVSEQVNSAMQLLADIGTSDMENKRIERAAFSALQRLTGGIVSAYTEEFKRDIVVRYTNGKIGFAPKRIRNGAIIGTMPNR